MILCTYRIQKNVFQEQVPGESQQGSRQVRLDSRHAGPSRVLGKSLVSPDQVRWGLGWVLSRSQSTFGGVPGRSDQVLSKSHQDLEQVPIKSQWGPVQV
jgi:hypothetical protein